MLFADRGAGEHGLADFFRRHVVSDLRQIVRNGREEFHPFFRPRVRERQALGVKERTGEALQRAELVSHASMHPAVERIANNRVADRAQVHADLMRAARLNRNT